MGKDFMRNKTTKPAINADREREIAEAQADVMRRAALQGVKPFTSLQDFAGDPEMTVDFDVDAFFRQLREERNRASSWSGD
jgi:hypothetical protein